VTNRLRFFLSMLSLIVAGLVVVQFIRLAVAAPEAAAGDHGLESGRLVR
jgi:hypothetical protein